MRYFFVCFLALIFFFSLGDITYAAPTFFEGTISENTVWTASSSPYVLTGKVIISEGVTLTIEQGAVVKLWQQGIVVNGSLVVTGAEAEPVYITSQKDDTVGGDTNNDGSNTLSAAANWQGIQFNAGASGTFDHAVIRYAGYSYFSSIPAISTIHNLGAQIIVRNSELAFSKSCGIGQVSGTALLYNSRMHSVACGAGILGGSLTLENNTIEDSGIGLFSNGAEVLEINSNTFQNNDIAADFDLQNLDLVHSGNTASGGGFNGFFIRGTIDEEVHLTRDSMPYIISSSGGSSGAGGIKFVRDNNLMIASTGALALEPGVIVKMHDSGALFVSGALDAQGASGDPVYFTSIKDDSVGEDTNGDGDASVPAPGDWFHVRFEPGSTGNLNNTVVRYGGYDYPSYVNGDSLSNIFNKGGTISVTASEIAYGKKYGLRNDSGSTTISQSNIHDNTDYGVINSSSVFVDARNNYWGDPSGPYHEVQNITGLGDRVSSNVLFEPWKGVFCTENCYSNVLFLPGIMGSRLYEESDVCGLLFTEKERWMSTTDCNQLRLMTDAQGASLNDIYTKAGNDSVIDEALIFNLYKTFFNALEDWKENEVITDYAAVPYDWRLRLDDILKTKKDGSTGKITYNPDNTVTESYLYQTVLELAAKSSTGKVTIVAHSNGGLLAKTFLATLQNTNDPLLEKVDNLILVGSPQLGTPSTLLGMLQGDEVGPLGVVVSQQTTRQLMNTMPFAFHLLPSANYFNSTGLTVDTPVLSFESGEVTTPWATTFGSEIKDVDSLQTFLSVDSGRPKPAVDDLAHPEVVDRYLFDYTHAIDQLMNTWEPSASMHVYQIAGVGLPTRTGLTYFTDKECITRSFPNVFRCAEYQPKLGYRVNEVVDGDSTVVTPSALAMSDSADNVERWWLNLDDYNSAGIGGSEHLNRKHDNIFEVKDVINFVQNTLQATTSNAYEYLTNTPATLPDEDRLIFSLHSPLDMSIVDENGGVISSSTVTIEGGEYNRYGELQHISLPGTPVDRMLRLNGTDFGSFTLEIEEYSGSTLDKRHMYSAIPSSTSTVVTMELENADPIEEAVLIVDYDGNGAPEITYNTQGEIISEFSYTTLINAINELPIKSAYKKSLLVSAKLAQQFDKKSETQSKLKKTELIMLRILEQQIIHYEREGIITATQKEELLNIINSLNK